MADVDGKFQTTIRLSQEAGRKLEQLAAEGGIGHAKLASLLLEELLPTVKSVRTRLQITRNGADGRG